MKRTILVISVLLGIFQIGNTQELQDGFNQFFYPNGQVSSEGTIREGKPDGYWKTYYTTGIIKSEGLRTNFFLDSTWTFYNPSGEVIQRIDYLLGKRNGYSYTYSYVNDPGGVLVARELYVNDKKEGPARYYHPNGNLKEEVIYDDNKREGSARGFNEEGELSMLMEYRNNYLVSRERVNRIDKEGKKQGQWFELSENGVILKEMFYKDNQLDGAYKEFSPSGQLSLILQYDEGKIRENEAEEDIQNPVEIRRDFDDEGNLSFQGSYRENIPVGIHRFFNSEGEVIRSEIYNEEGKKVSEGIIDMQGNRKGNWKNFYLTGAERSRGNYTNNQRNGRWSFFYENGNKEQEGDYLRGLPDGLWIWYYQDGTIRKEEGYFNGREDGESVEYDIEGNVIAKGSFLNGEKEGEWFYRVGDNFEYGEYQTGLKSGEWVSYYPGDIKRFEGDYMQGQANGKHKYYYPNGNLKEERYYEMGIRERNWKKYDSMGNLSLAVQYQRDVEYRINGERIKLPRGSVTVIK